MALDHKKAAEEILAAVGGKENIVSAAHCATRVRFVIADDEKVDKDAIEKAEGAKGSFSASGQLQVIYGTGTVDKVFDELTKIADIEAATTDDLKQTVASKGNLFQRAKALLPLLVPLFVSAFRRADELAIAMESRCYHGGEGRTRMKQPKWAARDTIALLLGLALLAAVIVLRKLGL